MVTKWLARIYSSGKGMLRYLRKILYSVFTVICDKTKQTRVKHAAVKPSILVHSVMI